MRTKIFPFLAVLLIGLTPLWTGLASCGAGQTSAESTMFATLKGSAAGIDAFRASYEAAFNAGQITGEQKTAMDRKFNQANDAIIEAAEALKAGMELDMEVATPIEVDRFVKELSDLVTTLVPPKPRI